MKVLAVIGCGLIGGSMALAWKKAGLVERVVACDLNEENLRDALELGAADAVTTSVADAVGDADVIAVAVPVLAMEGVFRAVAASMKPQAMITDVGSTRLAVLEMARRGLGDKFSRYAPYHPIAGGELPGVRYAQADLFNRKAVIGTPTGGMDPEVVQVLGKAWEAVGASVSSMTPELHDEVFASVSHLPHVLAFALVDMIAKEGNAAIKLGMAGAGFRDFTRIASSSPVMWRDICLTNGPAIAEELRRYRRSLDALQEAIDKADAASLEACFENAMKNRRGLNFDRS